MITEDKSDLTEWGGKRGKKGAEDFTYVEEGINSRIYIYMRLVHVRHILEGIDINK